VSNKSWRFVLEIDPIPAPRPRARAIITRGRPIATVYNPSEYKKWLADAQEQLIQQLGPDHPITGPVAVNLVVTVQKPKTSKLPFPKPDIDNFVKAVLDAMTDAQVWEDDTQVGQLTARKQWGAIGEITIEVTAAGDQ